MSVETLSSTADILAQSNLSFAQQKLLRGMVSLLHERFADKLISIVLFGSAARGTNREDSDVDLLVIYDENQISHSEFRDEFLASKRNLSENSRLRTGILSLDPHLISPLIMSRSEANTTPYVLLDIVDDGIILFDPAGFFANTKARICARLRELGAKRIFIEDGTWYWNLKPDAKFNEVITI